MLWYVVALFAPWSFVGVVKGVWSHSGRPRLWPSTHAALCGRLQEALQGGCALKGKADATFDHRMRETQETHERQRNGYPTEHRVLHGWQRCPREDEEVSSTAATTSSNYTQNKFRTLCGHLVRSWSKIVSADRYQVLNRSVRNCNKCLCFLNLYTGICKVFLNINQVIGPLSCVHSFYIK